MNVYRESVRQNKNAKSIMAVYRCLICGSILKKESPHEILGVCHDATLEQVKTAYRKIVKQTHPDKTGLSDPEREKKFMQATDAYKEIKQTRAENPARMGKRTAGGAVFTHQYGEQCFGCGQTKGKK
jgi:DnaJ-domain-containing protein 1